VTPIRTLVVALALLMSSGAHGGPACFAPTELAARPGEEKPVKGDHRFDAVEPSRALAAFKSVPPELRGAVRRVQLPKGLKLIALTLDLCEQPGEIAGYDGAIFDYLRANSIKATLFTGGKWMRSHRERVSQLMADPLFEIANHASAHRNLRLLSGTALTSEIEGPQRAYEAIRGDIASTNQCLAPFAKALPPRLGLFRFPYGACNAAALNAVNDAGLLAIQWDVSTGDPSPLTTANEIAREMLSRVKPGSIIIAHANGRGIHTAAGLPIAIPKLLAAGYQFVTVSELLAAGKPILTPTCYNARLGDTDRYDYPLGIIPKPKVASAGSSTTGTQSFAGLPWEAHTQVARPPATRLQSGRPAVQRGPPTRTINPPERLPWE
jgi:peptidoglycan-N-acetylglucosamine deacetylase